MMKSDTPVTDSVFRQGEGTTTELEVRLLGVASTLERENAQLRALLGASLRDTERIDWIGAEEADVDRIDRVETYWFDGVALRDAIDSAMKEDEE